MRAKLLIKYQQVGQQQLEEQRERVRNMLLTSSSKLKSSVNVISEPKVVAAQVVEHPSLATEHQVERLFYCSFYIFIATTG